MLILQELQLSQDVAYIKYNYIFVLFDEYY